MWEEGKKEEVGRALKHEREMKNEEPANRALMHDAVTRWRDMTKSGSPLDWITAFVKRMLFITYN